MPYRFTMVTVALVIYKTTVMVTTTSLIPYFQYKKNGLQIFLYYDDLEICNPPGSKRSVHKIGILLACVYMQKFLPISVNA